MERVAKLLLVDDDSDDVFLTKEGFRRSRFSVDLDHVENGIECMKYLRGEGAYEGRDLPDIILLDLNMPLMDGREVLKEIVADPELRLLPVIILTTSQAEQDVLEMYRLRCSSYIIKPVDFSKFQKAIEEFSDYWFSLVARPKKLSGASR